MFVFCACPFVCPSNPPFVNLSMCLSLNQYICMFINLSGSPFVYLSLYLVVNAFVCLFVIPSLYLLISLYICLLILCPSANPYVNLLIHMSACPPNYRMSACLFSSSSLSICLFISIYMSVCLYDSLPVCFSVLPSVNLSVHLSVNQYLCLYV